jgi:hypothetical protein
VRPQATTRADRRRGGGRWRGGGERGVSNRSAEGPRRFLFPQPGPSRIEALLRKAVTDVIKRARAASGGGGNGRACRRACPIVRHGPGDHATPLASGPRPRSEPPTPARARPNRRSAYRARLPDPHFHLPSGPPQDRVRSFSHFLGSFSNFLHSISFMFFKLHSLSFTKSLCLLIFTRGNTPGRHLSTCSPVQ